MLLRIIDKKQLNTRLKTQNFSLMPTLNCPKTWRKWPKTPTCRSKIKSIRYKTTCYILTIPWYSNISHSLICPKNWRKRLERLKILKFEHSFWALCLCTPSFRSRFLRKLKTIRHATIQHTLTIFTKPRIICARTYSKSWGNRPQRPKIFKIDHFS